jgi:hypothetical protein
MRVPFDQGVPAPLRRWLPGHDVSTAYERGWSRLTNVDLLAEAEREAFDVLVTTDTNLRYQQNLSKRRIAIVVLSTPSWPRIRQATEQILHAVDRSSEGSYFEVSIP